VTEDHSPVELERVDAKLLHDYYPSLPVDALRLGPFCLFFNELDKTFPDKEAKYMRQQSIATDGVV
jgi:hypothetical protein